MLRQSADVLYAAALAGVYLCVTLHEYGHVLAARRFGIGAVDITLLPIGGVARLKAMPRIPWQEPVVAGWTCCECGDCSSTVAGFFAFSNEAVLYAFKGAITFAIVGNGMNQQMVETMESVLLNPSDGICHDAGWRQSDAGLFNMLPAFPMDGGRVFRSLLAMFLNYGKATWIASRVGLLCAAGMAFFALNSGLYIRS